MQTLVLSDRHSLKHELTLSASFFFNDTATTEIYTLSLHDALPIWARPAVHRVLGRLRALPRHRRDGVARPHDGAAVAVAARVPSSRGKIIYWNGYAIAAMRSEEHTYEFQSG